MFRGVSWGIRGCLEVSRCLRLVSFGKGDGKQGTIRMHIRVCSRCLAQLLFSLHAQSVGQKLKFWQIASISRYSDLPILLLYSLILKFRFANSICTTTSTRSLSPNTPSTQGDSATSRVAGELAKTRLSFGAGSRDSELLCSLRVILPNCIFL